MGGNGWGTLRGKYLGMFMYKVGCRFVSLIRFLFQQHQYYNISLSAVVWRAAYRQEV